MGGSDEFSREQLSPKALEILELYDTLLPRPGSKEFAKARIRMVRDIIWQGALGQQIANGLKVSQQELTTAWLGLHEMANGDILQLVTKNVEIYQTRELVWWGVKRWEGLPGNGPANTPVSEEEEKEWKQLQYWDGPSTRDQASEDGYSIRVKDSGGLFWVSCPSALWRKTHASTCIGDGSSALQTTPAYS